MCFAKKNYEKNVSFLIQFTLSFHFICKRIVFLAIMQDCFLKSMAFLIKLIAFSNKIGVFLKKTF